MFNFRWLNKAGWIYVALPEGWHISCLSMRLQRRMDMIGWKN